MMLDKIGIMGNTQGVMDNNRPAKKKPVMANQTWPDFNNCVLLSASLLMLGAVVALVAALGAAVAIGSKATVRVFLIGA
jgi:hypothetical protein